MKSALEVLAAQHKVEGDLLPQAALSVVLWIDEKGNEQVTIYVAQSASGTTLTGMLSQALHIINEELIGERQDG